MKFKLKETQPEQEKEKELEVWLEVKGDKVFLKGVL